MRSVNSLVGVSVLVMAAGSVLASCPAHGDPTAALGCYAAAVSNKNLQELETLLASDFQSQSIPMQGAPGSSRAVEISSFDRLFDEASSLSLEFGTPYRIVHGTESGTWRIEGASWSNSMMLKGNPVTITSSSSIVYVREVADPDPRYEIYRLVSIVE
jgi:hypothetical protein